MINDEHDLGPPLPLVPEPLIKVDGRWRNVARNVDEDKEDGPKVQVMSRRRVTDEYMTDQEESTTGVEHTLRLLPWYGVQRVLKILRERYGLSWEESLARVERAGVKPDHP